MNCYTDVQGVGGGGYIPSLMMASPTHLEIMTAIMMGTMYVSPPVNSNMMTTRDTGRERGGGGSYNLENILS